MTCAPELDRKPATLEEANEQLAILQMNVDRARNLLNAGGELPQLGYTEGDVTIQDGVITVPLSTSLCTARLVLIPVVAERLIRRLNEALAEHYGYSTPGVGA